MKLLLAFVAMAAMMDPAQARCVPVLHAMKYLDKQHSEHPIFTVTGEPGKPSVIVFTNPEKKTWTVVTVAAGIACFRAAGKGDIRRHATPEPGEPS